MIKQNTSLSAENQVFTLPLFPEEEISWLAFDLEIAKILPDEPGELKRFRPLGISCAATLSSEGKLDMWVEKDQRGNILQQLTMDTAASLAGYLDEQNAAGCRIVTWNGLGFDFDILYEESGGVPVCKSLALNHTDMMFHVFCEKGYPLSLDKAARGMGLPGKTEGIQGAQAPVLWQQGEHQTVLDYLAQDVRVTLDLALAGDRQRALRWVSGSGKMQELKLPRGWLPVSDALNLPLPDTSWMDAPWPREKFTGWLNS